MLYTINNTTVATTVHNTVYILQDYLHVTEQVLSILAIQEPQVHNLEYCTNEQLEYYISDYPH
jgi:hypothetical protein